MVHIYNINEWYSPDGFEDALRFANKYQEIIGVEENICQLQDYYDGYKQEMKAFIERENAQAERMKNTYLKMIDRASLLRTISKVSFVVMIVGIVLAAYFSSKPTSSYWISEILSLICCLGILSGFLCGIGAIVYRACYKIYGKKYERHMEILLEEKEFIQAKYYNGVRPIRDEVDRLYLNSLEPSHREIVLMRREQDRYQRQMISMQRQQQETQKEHQRKLEEEQQKTREAQEKLLKIEQEKNAYRRW